jgi:hypothetical protein
MQTVDPAARPDMTQVCEKLEKISKAHELLYKGDYHPDPKVLLSPETNTDHAKLCKVLDKCGTFFCFMTKKQ